MVSGKPNVSLDTTQDWRIFVLYLYSWKSFFIYQQNITVKSVIISIAGIGVIKYREQAIIDLMFNCDGRKIIAVWLIRVFDRVYTGKDSCCNNDLDLQRSPTNVGL